MMQSTLPLQFRVWHRLRKKMYVVLDITGGFPAIIREIVTDGRPVGNEIIYPQASTHLRVMQASPFCDSNKRPIFELDLLHIEHGPRIGQVGLVGFFNGCFMVEFDQTDEAGVPLMVLVDVLEYGVTVIGVAKNLTEAMP